MKKGEMFISAFTNLSRSFTLKIANVFSFKRKEGKIHTLVVVVVVADATHLCQDGLQI